jgi:hypothetical protein
LPLRLGAQAPDLHVARLFWTVAATVAVASLGDSCRHCPAPHLSVRRLAHDNPVEDGATEWLLLITLVAFIDACKFTSMALLSPPRWPWRRLGSYRATRLFQMSGIHTSSSYVRIAGDACERRRWIQHLPSGGTRYDKAILQTELAKPATPCAMRDIANGGGSSLAPC